ncbi:MAG: COX15/CtaA family protein [Gemmatimonadales bacterium]|nr:COX15/CtaA family protein [Gemmatimonadales bacterium]MDZ4389653.1 COX15/CtaA family protein [Gemmatimonadales bacterium]
MTTSPPLQTDRAVRRWLIISAMAVVVAVVVGGITRLTDSGLSITEWRPISGIFPPLNSADWDTAYQRFLQIPQAQTTHRGISPESFRWIYWWEWFHRMLARLVGVILALPYLVLRLRGAIRTAHRRRLLLLPILAATQGALGWWMVSSGLAVRISVSPVRLTIHLGVALVILCVCIWTMLELTPHDAPPNRRPRSPALRRGLMAGFTLTFLTLLSGGLVAGLDAGLIYNSFPRMGPNIVPEEYARVTNWWQAVYQNPVIVQFHHRVLALLTASVLLALAWAARHSAPSLQRATAVMAGVVVVQVGLGIATLLLQVPVVLGVLHQLTGLAVLSATLWAVQRTDSGERGAAEPRG